jgi:AraC-like DNA-binding protein
MSQQVPYELIRRQLGAIRHAGYPTRRLDKLDLPSELLSDTVITGDHGLALGPAGLVFQYCKESMQDTTYGFEQRPPEPKQQALLLFLGTLDCPTLGTMLRKQGELVAYMGRANEFALSLSSTQERQLASAGFARQEQPSTIPQHYIAGSDVMHLFWWYMSYCWLINQNIPLQRVELMGGDNCWAGLEQTLAELFGCPVAVGCPQYAINFEPHWLEQPLHRSSSEVEEMFANIGEACASIPPHRDTSMRLQELLADTDVGLSLQLEQAAEQLHLSRQTLIRHLRTRGTSFQELKDQQRLRTATELLRDTDLSLADIGDRLGFANSSAFTRACKRWCQLSPSALRRQLRAGEDN